MINGHGDDRYQFGVAIKHNFSSNVYYKGCPPNLLRVLEQNIKCIQNYPSPAATELNNCAANYFKLDNNQFLFTNGATEAFYLIAQSYQGTNAWILGPTFAEYADACTIFGIDYQFLQRENLFTTDFKEQLVFICNPNNPDGAVLSVLEIEKLLDSFPKAHFIIDEAYSEFTTATQSVVGLTAQYDNLSVVRSLTKTFTIPGLRLGYVVSNAGFINRLLTFKMPWSVNSLAIISGIYIFENYEQLRFDVSELMAETAIFKTAINSIDYLTVIEGHTNYFLVKLNTHTAAALKQYLMVEHQILIRDATNFTGLAGQHIRLSVQELLVNQTLIQALKQWS